MNRPPAQTRANVKRLPGVIGFGVMWDEFTRSLVVALFVWCWKFHIPRVGACKNCGHGPDVHRARRDHGVIQWRCGIGALTGHGCDCEHYDPETK